MDAGLGHSLLAAACRAATTCLPPSVALAAPDAVPQGPVRCGRAYALRHGVAHACLGMVGRGHLAELLLDVSFWGDVHRSGESWQAAAAG